MTTFAPRAGGPRPAPTLSTERLTLGPMDMDDWPAWAAVMMSDRAVHMGGPYALGRAWATFATAHGGWALTGAGSLSIRTAQGIPVGEIAFNDLPHFPELELGWMLYDGHEGNGYATEAATAVLRWIVAEVRPASLVSYISPDNDASAALARRIGGRHDPAAAALDPDDLVFRHIPEAA